MVIFDIKPVSLLLTVGTPLTLLSLVLKGTIEDVLFGIYLMFSGAYKRGDHIFIQDRNIEGYIASFGLKLVEIKTFDNNVVFLKNYTFANSLVVNKNNISGFNTTFAINIKFSNVDEVNDLISFIQKHIKNTYDNLQKINFRLKEIKSNVAYLNMDIYFSEEDKTQILNKELSYVGAITDLITSKGGSVENVYNFTI